jgi:hypothetical protein
MTTIDNLLLTIINHPGPGIETLLAPKDASTLRSLAHQAAGTYFITENQSNLLLKILQSNKKKLSNLDDNLVNNLANPTWSRPFRQVEQIKKLYIAKVSEDLEICIEFTFSANIRKVLQQSTKYIENLHSGDLGKKWYAELTEKNIVSLVELLTPFDFDISKEIISHYNIIKSWNETEIKSQFLISNIENNNFQKHITADLGIDTQVTQYIINDRSMRYQYLTDTTKNLGENLTEYIANRSNTRVWVDRKEHTLDAVIESITDLTRYPLLVVFQTESEVTATQHLEMLINSLEKYGINSGIGVYFRFSNSPSGAIFNKIIADRQLNAKLDQDTKVACILGSKLPKFFLKTSWKPMSVLGLNTKLGLRHGKTSVYSKSCDLVLDYCDEPPLLEHKITIKWP